MPVPPAVQPASPILTQADEAERLAAAQRDLEEALQGLSEAEASGEGVEEAQERLREAQRALEEAQAAAGAAERAEAERLEAERAEAERAEAERAEAERAEAERLEAERSEAERLEAERAEAERLEAERIEAERAEAERLEAERTQTEAQEAERERREGRDRADRPSLRERMEERRQAEPEPEASVEPEIQAAPGEPPAEVQEAQPEVTEREERRRRERPDEAPAEVQEAQPEPPAEVQEAQPEVTEREGRARRDRRERPSLRERIEELVGRDRDPERERREAIPAPEVAPELPEDAEVVRREADDRVIIRRGGRMIVRKDETQRMRRFAREMETERLRNGWTRTVATDRDGVRVVTVWDEYGDIVERVRILPDGREIVLIDTSEERRGRRWRDRREVRLPQVVVQIPREQYIVEARRASRTDIHRALTAPPVQPLEELYTLQEVREHKEVRDLVPSIDIDTITFEFDSAEIPPDQLDALEVIGLSLEDILFDNPEEIFLVEGHTDAVGGELYNLALSDRRAESVAFALSDYFDVPPENLITQGYGKQFLKIDTPEPERQNRRVTIRRITPLIMSER